MLNENSNNVQVIAGEERTVYKLTDETVDMVSTSYTVFSGINLVYHDVHVQESKDILDHIDKDKRIFEINFCSEGRVECASGEVFSYLTGGDISIHKLDQKEQHVYFPSSRYRGLSILIDVDEAPRCLSCFLNDVNVRPEIIMDKFCHDNRYFIARNNSRLEHIFSELYQIPEEIRKPYQKIKVLEILLFLSNFRIEETEQPKKYSASQVVLAKNICNHLLSHKEERITIEDLTKIFHASATQIKNSFKGVYGESIYSFIRAQKMESAAYELKTTDKTILEIANMHGYDNASKFAAAFRDTMGMSPREYRHNNLDL